VCGIYGYNWFDKLLADELGRLLRHRGPDESGLVEVSSGTIGVRRLSIIDRAGGRQPMASPDSTLVIAYNGEVYNYRDLMNRLARLGHRFATQSDTEVVLHAYEEWGESGLSKLNGMFAFAVVDRNTDSWFLARDPFGIKPLYYSNDGKKFAFASEIAPLLLMPWVGRVARSNLLTRFIAAGILPEDRPETLFMDVYKVRPGHILTFQDGKLETKRFLPKWTVKPAQTKNIDELTKETDDILLASVQMRRQSEVPAGTCLSGGLDSSSLVGVINKLLLAHLEEAKSVGSRQHVFSAVYGTPPIDEEEWIDLVVNATGVKANKVTPSSAGLIEELDTLIRAQEEPFQSPSVYAQWCVMRLAKTEVTVLLDGQGADEVFGGYETYLWHFLWDCVRHRDLRLATAIAWYGNRTWLKFAKLWYSARKEKALARRIFGTALNMTPDEPSTRGTTEDEVTNDMELELPTILRYADKNSMAFSVEVRLPFLDPHLVSLLLGLPMKTRMHQGQTKALLRIAMRELVPREVVERKDKVSYDVPEVEWLEESGPVIERVFAGPPWRDLSILGGRKVSMEFRRSIRRGMTPKEARLYWRLLFAGTWLRVFDLRVK